MIEFEVSGNFNNIERFLRRVSKIDLSDSLNRLAQQGVSALASATPIDSGISASSWGYEITRKAFSTSISWTNSHMADGVPVVILLQYGHGTGTGGYVRGRNFINPAIQPIFDEIAEDLWKVVTSA